MRFYNCLIILFSLFTNCNRVPQKNETLDFIPFLQGEYYGYLDNDGNTKINPQYKQAYVFKEDLALVQNSVGKYGYINKTGQYEIQAVYKDAKAFYEGLALVLNENGNLQYIDKSGKVIIALTSNFQEATSFIEGLALVKQNEKYGFIDKKGKVVIPPVFESLSVFNDGFAVFREKTNQFDEFGLEIYKFGFINRKGEKVIPAQFDEMRLFTNKIAPVRIDKLWGFINESGKFIINPQYDFAGNFVEGLCQVEQGELRGFIDQNGNFVINPQYKEAYAFNKSGTAPVKSLMDGKWGYINIKGEYLIQPQFDTAEQFVGDMAVVSLNGKMGMIDIHGKYVINPIYDELVFSPDSFDYLLTSNVVQNGSNQLSEEESRVKIADSLASIIDSIEIDSVMRFGN